MFPNKTEHKNKKIGPIILSWFFFFCSFFIATKVPAARVKLKEYNVFYLIKIALSDYRILLSIVALIVAVLLILIPIEIYDEKIRGVKPDPEESKKVLESLWLFLEVNRIIVIILGILVLTASFFGLNISSILK